MRVHRSLAALLLVLPLAGAIADARAQAPGLVGTWDGTFEPPGVVGGDPFSLRVLALEGAAVRGELVVPSGVLPFAGTLSAGETGEPSTLAFEVSEPGGEPLRVELRVGDGALTGLGRNGTLEYGFRARRASPEPLERSHAPRAVDLAGKERPETFSLIGLETEVGFALDELVRETAEQNGIVGLSIACVVGGELVDVRSIGWEDFFGDVPASDETRYRWASISKPLTASAALRMAARKSFDLDADVRALVPEFPAPSFGGAPVTITPRHILCHQSGIVHYAGARRTWREYDAPHPFERLSNALDLFATAPLLAAPGTVYSYSTHAWSLLGLCMERAAKKPYAEVVRELVLEPLAMRSTEPDFPSRAIPHRSSGYEHTREGRLVETFEDDVSWKLPGGGWLSTVGDLARFGAGLLGDGILDSAMKEQAWTPRRLPDGSATDVGLGFVVGELAGQRLISHSGGQRKASTFLAVLPERGLAVAAMSNTDVAPMGDLATAALRLLLDAER